MKHIIDIDTWERRDNYNFFRTFHNSWISITSEVECGEALAAAKASGRSFFLYYLYAILRAANEVKEFRFRTDKHGNVVYHDTVDMSTPIALPGKTFYTVRIPYHEDFECFYAEARRIITSIPEDGDPYGTDKEIEEKGDYDVVQLSATPPALLHLAHLHPERTGAPAGLSINECRKGCHPGWSAGDAHRLDCQPRFCRRSAYSTVLSES